jgi:Domain of unknown function (DUF4386)
MALGAVAFRLIEGVFYALSAVGTLIMFSLSDQLTSRASAHASADLVRDLHDSAGCVGVLPFYTGATLYYLIFYRSPLIPRWLSVWCLAGTVLGPTAGMLVLFRSIAPPRHADSAQPPHCRAGDGPGGVADRGRAQPEGDRNGTPWPGLRADRRVRLLARGPCGHGDSS